MHVKIISERLGHGNIRKTMNIYGYLLQTADQAADCQRQTRLIIF